MSTLTHIGKKGNASMVDVSGKKPTKRTATARAKVNMKKDTLRMVFEGKVPKGDVISTARLAGIMAAKSTASLIPLCHPLNITHASVDIEPDWSDSSLAVSATASTIGPTGAEMEALCAVAVACLTVYDMCKSADRGMAITGIELVEKRGGKSGVYKKRASKQT